MMGLLRSDELWKSVLLFISMLCFIYDPACSPMLVDALAKKLLVLYERVFMLDSGFMPLFV